MAGKRSGKRGSSNPREAPSAQGSGGGRFVQHRNFGDLWLYQGKISAGVVQRVQPDGQLDPNEVPVVSLTANVSSEWGAAPGDPSVGTLRIHFDPSQAREYGELLIRMAQLLELDPTGRTGPAEDPFSAHDESV